MKSEFSFHQFSCSCQAKILAFMALHNLCHTFFMESNSPTMMTKVISPPEIAIKCTFTTLKALKPVRR